MKTTASKAYASAVAGAVTVIVMALIKEMPLAEHFTADELAAVNVIVGALLGAAFTFWVPNRPIGDREGDDV
jgi:uncharacterized membrane protein YccC